MFVNFCVRLINLCTVIFSITACKPLKAQLIVVSAPIRPETPTTKGNTVLAASNNLAKTRKL